MKRADSTSLRILLTADPMIPVPPTGYGGIERIVDSLVRAYRADGHEVGLLSHPDSTADASIRFAWPSPRVSGTWATLRNSAALLRASRRFRPDVIHSFSRLAYLAPVLGAAVPKVMSYQRHAGGRQVTLASRLAGRSLRFTGCSDFICAMGRPSGGEWRSVPNFVEPQRYTFVPRVADDAPLVFLSRIDPDKGAALAIAVARASGRRLLLAGNRGTGGPELDYWNRQIAPCLGRDGIEWVGEVDDVRKNELLGQAAALLVPVQWDEPFGIVFAEALACGTPILSCRRGALPEIVEEGRTGLFFRTVEEGAAAVGRLPRLDRAACRRAVEGRFSLDRCAAQYLALYRELL